MSDKLIKLFFPGQSCRGEVLQAGSSWREAVGNQNLPACVKSLLGQMTAAAIMLAARLKSDASVVLQIQGDGPVRLAITEVRPGLTFRSAAQLRVHPDQVPANASMRGLVNVNGRGCCVLIIDPAGRRRGEQPWQGIVPLAGSSVAEAVEAYLQQSEQLDSRLWLFADDHSIGGVFLQHVASSGGNAVPGEIDPDGLEHLAVLASTAREDEILRLDPIDMARRLFWEDNPGVKAEMPVRFGCRCSREGIEAMVKNLGVDESRSIIREMGKIEVTCEFCGKKYVLDSVDVEALFASAPFAGRANESVN